MAIFVYQALKIGTDQGVVRCILDILCSYFFKTHKGYP